MKGPFTFKDESFLPVHANRMPRTAKEDFKDALESFESLVSKFEMRPSRELFEALKYMDAFIAASFHNAFKAPLFLSKEEELLFMKENKRRRQCLQPLGAHIAAFNEPSTMQHARSLADCIDEAREALSRQRRKAANTRWNKQKSKSKESTHEHH